jgi:hypothetical protein
LNKENKIIKCPLGNIDIKFLETILNVSKTIKIGRKKIFSTCWPACLVPILKVSTAALMRSEDATFTNKIFF